MNQAQRGKQAFHTVRQRIRRRRERHDGRAHDQEAQADRHLQGKLHTLAGNFKNPELDQDLPRRQQNIEDHGDEKKQQYRFHAFQHQTERNLRQNNQNCQGNSAKSIAKNPLYKKEGNDIQNSTRELNPGIQPVQYGVCRIILSEYNLAHRSPFRSRCTYTPLRNCR